MHALASNFPTANTAGIHIFFAVFRCFTSRNNYNRNIFFHEVRKYFLVLHTVNVTKRIPRPCMTAYKSQSTKWLASAKISPNQKSPQPACSRSERSNPAGSPHLQSHKRRGFSSANRKRPGRDQQGSTGNQHSSCRLPRKDVHTA